MKNIDNYGAGSLALPKVRRVSKDRPFHWLRAGLQDLLANPLPSLAYGLLFGIGGDLIILAMLDYSRLVSFAVSGFFLVAPLLAAGLYELSRATAAGRKLFFIESLQCFRRNGQTLALFGLLLAMVTLAWERVSAVTFRLLGATRELETHAFINEVLFGGEHQTFLVTWLLLGALIALAVFAVAVVSVPMMLDRNSDLSTAMVTSLRAVAANPLTLLIWAVLLVALVLIGYATLLFGLVVIMPILGHASWHAYRDLVD